MSAPSVRLARQYGEQPKHHPVLYRTGRFGCWGFCACGWESPVLSNVMSVHLAFGIHLVDAESPAPVRGSEAQG